LERAAKPSAGLGSRLAVLLALMIGGLPVACAVGTPGILDVGAIDAAVPDVAPPPYNPPPPPPPPPDLGGGGQDLAPADVPVSSTPDAPFDGPAAMTDDVVAPPPDQPMVVPEGPPCQIDGDCDGEQFRVFCNLQSHHCVECRTDGDCENVQPNFPYCDTQLTSCGNCRRGGNADCTDALGGQICLYDDSSAASSYYRCGCGDTGDCPAGRTCMDAVCQAPM
jgi:hypothetical protein